MPPVVSGLRALRKLAPLVGGGLGATYGAQTAEEGESPLLRGLGYGALGGVMLPMGAGAVARGYQQAGGGAAGVGGAITDYTYFSFLSSPDGIARGSFGAVGGAVTAALEKGLEGALTRDWEKVADGTRIIKSLVTEGPGIWGRAVKANPEEFARMYRQYMPSELARDPTGLGRLGAEQHMGGVGIGTFYGGPDMAAVNAMTKGGFSRADAARYTLTGSPQSSTGQGILEFQRGMRKRGGIPSFVATQAAPFARVGLLGLEKGLQRTPIVGSIANWAMKTGATPAQQLAQQSVGAGAGWLGYKSGDEGSIFGMDPRVGLVAGPLAGAAFLPFQAGREFRRQRERGRVSVPELAGELFRESSPLGFQPLALGSRPQTEVPRRFIPAGVADIATALDPAFGRERGRAGLEQAAQRGEYTGPLFPGAGAAMARLPGLREQLPETFAPVDIFGQPRYAGEQPALPFIGRALTGGGPVREALSRTMFPALESAAPPAMNQMDPLMAQLASLGIQPGAPTANVTLPGTGLPLQQTAQSAAAVQRYRGIARQLAANIVTQIPQLQQLPDGPQKQYLARLLMEDIQERISRVLSAGTLPLSLSQGAQLPALLGGRRP